MHIHTPSISMFAALRKKEASKTLGFVFLALVVLSGSTGSSFGKQLTNGLSPLSMLFVTEFLSVLFTIMTFGALNVVSDILKLPHKKKVPLLIVGITNGVIAPLIAFTGLHITQAVNAELFLRSTVLFLPIMAMIFLNEKIDRSQMIAGAIIVLGIATVALRGFTTTLSLQQGDMLILVSAFIYAAGGIIFKKYLSDLHPQSVIFTRSICALALIAIISPLMGPHIASQVLNLQRDLLPALIGFAFIARFLYLFSFYEAMEHLPVHVVSFALPLSMVGGVTFAAFYLGEHVYWYHFLGGALIILGIILMQTLHIHMKPKHVESHLKTNHKHHI